MANSLPISFDHSHHKLVVRDNSAQADVLSFTGEESLSAPFTYNIQFTSSDKNIDPTTKLMKDASLTLQAPVAEAFGVSVQQPQRVIQGVVTGFKRLSTSKDESRYELCRQPRMALLARSHQNRIYQDISVPGIVEKTLRERHDMRGQDFVFTLAREYPRREQVMHLGMGRFSPNGKYVAPAGPDCEGGESVKESPGVWDLDDKKRITFKVITNSNGAPINEDDILKKCEGIINSK